MMENTEIAKVTVDGVSYEMANVSKAAKTQILNIKFVDEQMVQFQNELAFSETAQSGYLSALGVELKKIEKAGE